MIHLSTVCLPGEELKIASRAAAVAAAVADILYPEAQRLEMYRVFLAIILVALCHGGKIALKHVSFQPYLQDVQSLFGNYLSCPLPWRVNSIEARVFPTLSS